MDKRPTLETERLVIRPFTLDDAPDVRLLAGDEAIAATTLNIPHPYEEGVAEAWIGMHRERFESGELVNFAIERHSDYHLVGSISLVFQNEHGRAEMGYWIGKPYWNNGYCTEAAAAVLEYGFVERKINRIIAHHILQNTASGRVMQKTGMTHEGRPRKHILKWDR
ncbi:MAG: GNAT family N-acetyltransferase [Anaerolineales bacterium]|nr:GNAT family N-acetyltransferase [Anaerolineales bacterium]